jgi:hypothetical protein
MSLFGLHRGEPRHGACRLPGMRPRYDTSFFALSAPMSTSRIDVRSTGTVNGSPSNFLPSSSTLKLGVTLVCNGGRGMSQPHNGVSYGLADRLGV